MQDEVSASGANIANDMKFTKLEIVQQNTSDELQRKLLSASQEAIRN